MFIKVDAKNLAAVYIHTGIIYKHIKTPNIEKTKC